MEKYFVHDTEVAETEAAGTWFSYAANNDLEISKAIDIWEDAATPEGEGSRATISKAGIRIEFLRN